MQITQNGHILFKQQSEQYNLVFSCVVLWCICLNIFNISWVYTSWSEFHRIMDLSLKSDKLFHWKTTTSGDSQAQSSWRLKNQPQLYFLLLAQLLQVYWVVMDYIITHIFVIYFSNVFCHIHFCQPIWIPLFSFAQRVSEGTTKTASPRPPLPVSRIKIKNCTFLILSSCFSFCGSQGTSVWSQGVQPRRWVLDCFWVWVLLQRKELQGVISGPKAGRQEWTGMGEWQEGRAGLM